MNSWWMLKFWWIFAEFLMNFWWTFKSSSNWWAFDELLKGEWWTCDELFKVHQKFIKSSSKIHQKFIKSSSTIHQKFIKISSKFIKISSRSSKVHENFHKNQEQQHVDQLLGTSLGLEGFLTLYLCDRLTCTWGAVLEIRLTSVLLVTCSCTRGLVLELFTCDKWCAWVCPCLGTCALWLYMWCHLKRLRYRFRKLCFMTAALWFTSVWTHSVFGLMSQCAWRDWWDWRSLGCFSGGRSA